MRYVVHPKRRDLPNAHDSSSARSRSSALLRALTLAALTLSASGCPEDDDYDERGVRGDLGVGKFVYECLGVNDSACSDGTTGQADAIAVGGRFHMTFTVRSGPTPLVIPPATDQVRREDGAFVVLASGTFPLLAVTGNSEVVDLYHLRGAAIAEVRVQEEKELPVSLLRLAENEAVTLSAVPFDARGVRLAGALTYTWRSGDTARLVIESLPQLHRVRVRARAPGRVPLMVDVAGKTFSIDVEIGDFDGDAGASGDGGAIDGAAGALIDGAVDASGDADVAADAGATTDGGAL